MVDELAAESGGPVSSRDAAVSVEGEAAPLPDLVSSRSHSSDAIQQHTLFCQFLGPFRLFDNDRQLVRWRNRRSLSTLILLAAHHPSPVHSEVLMDAFWPSSDPKAARNNLHVAVYGLRRSFEDSGCSTPHVVFENDCYGFAANLTVSTDVQAFEAAAARGVAIAKRGDTQGALAAYREALSLYSGAYLENDPYSEWAQIERIRLQRKLCDVLDDLGSDEMATGDLGSCVASTMRLIELDPYDERAHRRLMRAYARLGRHHLAITLYETFALRSASELKSFPQDETQSLVSRIRHRRPV